MIANQEERTNPNRLTDLPRFNVPWHRVPEDLEMPAGLIPEQVRATFVAAGHTKRFFSAQEQVTLKDGSEINLLGVVYRWPDVNTREKTYAVERCVDKQIFLATEEQYRSLLTAEYLADRKT